MFLRPFSSISYHIALCITLSLCLSMSPSLTSYKFPCPCISRMAYAAKFSLGSLSEKSKATSIDSRFEFRISGISRHAYQRRIARRHMCTAQIAFINGVTCTRFLWFLCSDVYRRSAHWRTFHLCLYWKLPVLWNEKKDARYNVKVKVIKVKVKVTEVRVKANPTALLKTSPECLPTYLS